MKFAFLLPMLLFPWFLHAQTFDISGQWDGVVIQNNSNLTFSFQMNLTVSGNDISGVSLSINEKNGATARFNLAGFWDGDKAVIQEIEQVEPQAPKWCKKLMKLMPRREGNLLKMEGEWKANGCSPGKVIVQKRLPFNEVTVEEEVAVPFTIEGTWTGHLGQTDRDYGFYYEINLEPGNKGVASIDSDGPGGLAKHEITWSFNDATGVMTIKEGAIIEQSIQDWRWCVKTAQLQMTKENSKYILEGGWIGHIAGYTQESGPCAPGRLHIEKPILTETVQRSEVQYLPYEQNNARKVNVKHVVEVANSRIRIKVWDNGTVDGDVVTLFLNGEEILNKYRVVKRKYVEIVNLEEDNNYLILHAEDLGDIIPNTVAVAVDDGVKEQTIIVSSDLRESGAILIKQFSLNNNN